MIRTMVTLGCFVFGVGLLYLGYQDTQSVAGGIRKAVAGRYSTETIAYLASGAILVLVGLVLSLGGKNRKRGRQAKSR